jgi:hypothetical protein
LSWRRYGRQARLYLKVNCINWEPPPGCAAHLGLGGCSEELLRVTGASGFMVPVEPTLGGPEIGVCDLLGRHLGSAELGAQASIPKDTYLVCIERQMPEVM